MNVNDSVQKHVSFNKIFSKSSHAIKKGAVTHKKAAHNKKPEKFFSRKKKSLGGGGQMTVGADDRNRTCTPKALDPKSSASASSATSASAILL